MMKNGSKVVEAFETLQKAGLLKWNFVEGESVQASLKLDLSAMDGENDKEVIVLSHLLNDDAALDIAIVERDGVFGKIHDSLAYVEEKAARAKA
jgi:hypothetical protein